MTKGRKPPMNQQLSLMETLTDAEGASFVELALVLPLFLMMLIPVVDLGRGFYAAIEVASAAHAGAMYGVENPSDTDGMIQAAKGGASNLSNVSATAAYGCECSDGTSDVASCTSTPSCTYNYVTYVDVTVTVPTAPFSAIPDCRRQ